VKAVVYTEYGPPEVMRVEDVEKPIPTDDEVLIRLEAVSLNRSDWENLIGSPLYTRIGALRKPRHPILGSDIAGRVEQVGGNVKDLKPGDAVFGDIMWQHMSGFAEYVCARPRWLARVPPGMTFAEAAAMPQSAVIALQGIRDKGRVQPGQQVLINGAGGGGGAFAIQLAKSYGAVVTGVDNAGKFDFMRAMGADHVLDYTQQDYTRTGKQYDFVLDLIAHRSVFAYRRALKPAGRLYVVGGSVATFFQILILGPLIRRMSGRDIRVLAVRTNLKDMRYMAELYASGKLRPVIDRYFPLSKVPDALRYLGEGHAKGKVIITMDSAPSRGTP
jgi:NADPH:quinone reductase-like Zn-dependent oxidoreductase